MCVRGDDGEIPIDQKRNFMRLWLLLLFILPVTPSFAQTDRGFVADRPGATDSPITTLPGTYRIESGLYSYARDKDNGVETTTQTIGNLFFVAGVTQHSEVHIGFDSHVSKKTESSTSSNTDSGFGDTTLKYKHNFIGNDGGDIAFGIIPRLTYTSEMNGSDLLGGISLPISFGLPHKLSFAITPQWNLEEKSNGGNYSSQYLGLVLSRGVNDNLDVYIDYASVSSEESTFQAQAGLGIAHRLSDRMQWDLSSSFGVSQAATDLVLSGGIVYQWF